MPEERTPEKLTVDIVQPLYDELSRLSDTTGLDKRQLVNGAITLLREVVKTYEDGNAVAVWDPWLGDSGRVDSWIVIPGYKKSEEFRDPRR